MYIILKSRLRLFIITLAAILTASLALTGGYASAHGRRTAGRRAMERHGFERHRARRHREERHERHERRERHERHERWERRSSARHRRIIVTRPRHYPGKLVVNLPRRHTRLIVRGRPYYYYYDDGIYYYRYPSGYVVVGPPVGTIVPRLSIGFSTVWVGGSLYYYYGDVFYRRVPTGYVVVEPPETTTVVLQPPVVVQPAESASGRVSVIAARLNVRTGPSLSNPILYQVKQNTTLKVQGRDSEWLYVELPGGKHGWVMKEFTVPIDLPASG